MVPENLVRQLRNARGWTQADLAGKVGNVTRQTIAAIEKNDWCPSLDLAHAIAGEFELSIEAVFYPEEAGQAAEPGPDSESVATFDPAGASRA